jgi:hypothetical protein
MTRYAPLWQQKNHYPASLDRVLLNMMWPTGGVNQGLAASADSTTLVIKMSAGNAVVPLTDGTTALISSDGVEPVTLTQPPVSGSNRNDLIVATVRDSTVDAGTNDDFVFTAIAGVVNGAVPATPVNSLAIASILVTGGQNWITPAQVTDRRKMLGLNIPPPLGAGAPFASFTDSNGEVWVAKGGVNGGLYRKATSVLRSRVFRSSAWTLNTAGYVPLVMNAVTRDDYAVYDTTNGFFTAPVAGWWQFVVILSASASGAGQWVQAVLGTNGTTPEAGSTNHSGVGTTMTAVCVQTTFLNAGDRRYTLQVGSTALGGVASGTWTYATASYLGAGT